MIRATSIEDIPGLKELARATGVFKSIELDTLDEVLADFFRKPAGGGYHCCTLEETGQAVGFACYGPNTMTDRTWDLYWIAVAPSAHGRGYGTQLLHFVEADIRRQRGRLLVIETSSLPSYEPTRRFYAKHGYEPASTVRDFYADGDSLIVFRKRLAD